MTPVHSTSVAIRFWKKVRKTDSCWLWTGADSGEGDRSYGKLHIVKPDGTKTRRSAHRVAWELFVGPIPKGMEVCHNCPDGDNPACVNPAHLFLATHDENMKDAAKKKRMAHGMALPKTKLSDEHVRDIRIRKYDRWGEMSRVAREFGVSHPTIRGIVLGITRTLVD